MISVIRESDFKKFVGGGGDLVKEVRKGFFFRRGLSWELKEKRIEGYLVKMVVIWGEVLVKRLCVKGLRFRKVRRFWGLKVS